MVMELLWSIIQQDICVMFWDMFLLIPLPPSELQACRYCLVDSGDLVAPCECKGSGQWVHLSCLRQWQKSVLLTQSTHPKYQTRIDEICGFSAFQRKCGFGFAFARLLLRLFWRHFVAALTEEFTPAI